MEIKINVFTSCYSKMLARHKNPNDFYIQISRSLFYPKKGIDCKSIMSMIDVNYGENLGMYDKTLDDYEARIRGEEYNDILKEFSEMFTEKFLLADMADDEIAEIEQETKAMQEEVKKISTEDFLKDFENATLEDKESMYMFGFTENTLKDFAHWNPCYTFNFFILCFEDLETRYTEKDEKKASDIKAGDFKTCHRTRLAKVLNERFNLNITEW
ncbi:MAG: hypothetical protein NC489_29115 [Ruminococcus flavefaciens]|nr:hypothetical protein [Ruminococcus flavefaciens]